MDPTASRCLALGNQRGLADRGLADRGLADGGLTDLRFFVNRLRPGKVRRDGRADQSEGYGADDKSFEHNTLLLFVEQSHFRNRTFAAATQLSMAQSGGER